MDRFQYLMVLTSCALITLPLEFAFGARVWRRPRRLVKAILPAFILFVAWDIWATTHGTWDFSEQYTVGIELPGGLAVEELVFFVLIPVCMLLTLESVRNIRSGKVEWLKVDRLNGRVR